MNFKDKEKVRSQIQKIEDRDLNESELKQTFSDILETFLNIEGFKINLSHPPPNLRPFVCSFERTNEKIGIYVDSGVLNSNLTGLNRYIQFGNLKRFKRNIILLSSRVPGELVSQSFKFHPIEIEIIDTPKLKNWLTGLSTEIDDISEYKILFRIVNENLIKMILNNPAEIVKIEWRDFERLMADVLEEIGFKVELTPPSRDGGKDIILRCKNNNKTYIVEIKHWASGQKVSGKFLSEFLNVIINEERSKGLFISTFGFANNAFEGLTRIDREKIKVADKEKVMSLCDIYVRKRAGLLLPIDPVEEILFKETN